MNDAQIFRTRTDQKIAAPACIALRSAESAELNVSPTRKRWEPFDHHDGFERCQRGMKQDELFDEQRRVDDPFKRALTQLVPKIGSG